MDSDLLSLSSITIEPNDVEQKQVQIKYLWEALDQEWNNILLTESFVSKNVLDDGNSQFRSIEVALRNSKLNLPRMSHKKLRKLVADNIMKLSESEFSHILNAYREQPNGDWDPLKVKSKRQLSQHVRKNGYHFQGDNITLSLLSKTLDMDFVIFNENHTIEILSNQHKHKVILHYVPGHYKVVGKSNPKNKKVQTLFDAEDIQMILCKETFFLEHFLRCQEKTLNNFTLNELISYFSKLVNRKLSKEEKIILSNLLRSRFF